MNQFKCSKCGNIETRNNDTKVAKCSKCASLAGLKLQTCPLCGEEKYFSWNAKSCRPCADAYKRTTDGYGVGDPVEMVRLCEGKSQYIQKLIKYNWWTANEFACNVAECDNDAKAEQLYRQFLRGWAKDNHYPNSFANNYGNV